MSKRLVRSRRSVVVVGEGQVAASLREAFGGHGPERVPEPANDLSSPWVVDDGQARVLVVVAPAGEFGVGAHRGGETGRRDQLLTQARRAGEAAVAHGIDRVVVITSAMVHGAWPDRPVIEDDDEPADDAAGFTADLVAFEETVRAAVGRVPLTVLRPAVVVGPGVDTIVTRHFEAPRLLTVRGSERGWQLVHVEDLARAVMVAVDAGLDGTLTVGALRDGKPDVLPVEDVTALAGMRTVSLPEATALGAAERLYRARVLPSPASDLAFVVHPWTVSARRLHDAGWSAEWSSDACLEVLLAQVRGRVAVAGRRVGGRDAAALGAAGAAVALLGTAAVWRQARGRR
ncbi:NAD-dependent epimerase/dehydratase family protein [Oerskovia flava]|uniref:NAD-dependent epimerase/dehydratase family protein n=1 Tax=Oerskovia flava TaxID=2986422 RepID=UPI0022402429|nr:NAD-dependent epimerase/dehydratase family protein [Oerskovia sp. JB1-3-2]